MDIRSKNNDMVTYELMMEFYSVPVRRSQAMSRQNPG